MLLCLAVQLVFLTFSLRLSDNSLTIVRDRRKNIRFEVNNIQLDLNES